ncbi:MAG: hypothetical protein HQK53_09220 [Oligoflexia bacterium]|nr:hypothetical protein [Oligoflexia bacterium]
MKKLFFSVPVFFCLLTSSSPIFAYTLKIINRSNLSVCGAVVDGSFSTLKSHGWQRIENGKTHTYSDIKYILIRECGRMNHIWIGPNWSTKDFCIKDHHDFKYYTPQNEEMCSELGGILDAFFRVPNRDIVWSLKWNEFSARNESDNDSGDNMGRDLNIEDNDSGH